MLGRMADSALKVGHACETSVSSFGKKRMQHTFELGHSSLSREPSSENNVFRVHLSWFVAFAVDGAFPFAGCLVVGRSAFDSCVGPYVEFHSFSIVLEPSEPNM